MLSLNCKHVQHVKICLPCNFEVNPVTHFGVISLFSSKFQHFNTFCPLFQKLLEINVKFKLQTCSACQDLPTMQFWSKSRNPFWNYFPFFLSNFQHFNTFRPLFQKLLEINVNFKLQTCSACQDLPTMQFWSKSRNPFWSYFPFFIKISTF
jgi:hypothetical protein